MNAMRPNSTQIPDLILDRWLAELSGAETKIVLYVARRTYGFRRDSDTISIDQMASGIVTRDGRRLDGGTGLSRATVAKTVADLETKNVLRRIRHQDQRGGNMPSTFSLNLDTNFGVEVAPPRGGVRKSDPIPDTDPDAPDGGAETGWGESENQTPFESEGVQKSDPRGVQKSDSLGSENQTHNIQRFDMQSLDKQYIDRQQQHTGGAKHESGSASDFDVVVSDEDMKPTNEIQTHVERLTAIGITRRVAEKLAREYPDRIPDQVAYLPYRNARDSAATLIYAIEGNWSVPPAYTEAHEAECRKEREEAAREKIRAVQAAEREEKEKQEAAFAAVWQNLSDEKRAEAERTAWKQLAQGGGPVASRAKDVLRGELKPSEIMGGNALRAVFRAALERLILCGNGVSTSKGGGDANE